MISRLAIIRSRRRSIFVVHNVFLFVFCKVLIFLRPFRSVSHVLALVSITWKHVCVWPFW